MLAFLDSKAGETVLAQSSGEGQSNDAPTVRSVIGAGVTVRGDIEGVGELVIEGRVVGKVETGGLLVGEHAEIEGPVSVEVIDVCGRVSGSVQATSVHLRSTARVDGDVSYKTLRVDAGARFSGRCVVIEAEQDKVVSITRPDPPEEKASATEELAGMAARLRRVVEPRGV